MSPTLRRTPSARPPGARLTVRTLTTALALIATAVLAACGHHRGDLAGEGRKVFASAGCGDCHSRAGPGPDFATSEQLSRAQIRFQLNLGVGGMPSFRNRLTDHQETAVTEFVYQTLHHQRP
jgi:mono/diheme cytochrome c family protein